VNLHRFLAFDLGAESGRAVVGTLTDGQLSLEEIHRFPNEPIEVRGTLYWDVLALYNNMLKGLREYTGRYGESVDGIGIDTWGVDFGPLDRDGNLLQSPVHYRDRRTEGVLDEIRRHIAPRDLFQRTGMALSPVSTSPQLLSLRLNRSPLLESATTLLMMPDLCAYFLTGQARCERTDAVTTQLYDPRKCQWSEEVFRTLDLPRSIMPELVDPGTLICGLPETVGRSVGLKRAAVTPPCTHDTASAVAAVPGKGEDWAFLSSGTWSVMGVLTDKVVTSPEPFSAGVCNEVTLQSFFVCRNSGTLPLDEGWIASDPPKMVEAVRKVGKPTLVYKVLAAGRRCRSAEEKRKAIEWVYKNIKPTDATIIGLYPRYSDQVTETTTMVREILA
jgi:rhamnulokinase